MKKSISFFLLLSLITVGCGGGYSLSTYENPPKIGNESFYEDEELGEIELDLALLILDIGYSNDQIRDINFYNQTLDRLDNYDKIEYYPCSADRVSKLESDIEREIGSIRDKIQWDDYYVYLINPGSASQILIYETTSGMGHLFNIQ